MKWCQFEGTTFDRSRVTHFQVVENNGFHLNAFLHGVMHGDECDGEGSFGQSTLYLAICGNKESADKAIADICAGKYDLPGQGQFIELPISGGYETDFFNVDCIQRINYNPGGVRVEFTNGKSVDIGCLFGDGPVSGDYEKVTTLLEKHLGLESFGDWGADPEKAPVKELPVLKLHRTSLSWNQELVYEERAGNGVLRFWAIDAMNNARRLLLNDEQITSQTIGGLVDMASTWDVEPFKGSVHIEG